MIAKTNIKNNILKTNKYNSRKIFKSVNNMTGVFKSYFCTGGIILKRPPNTLSKIIFNPSIIIKNNFNYINIKNNFKPNFDYINNTYYLNNKNNHNYINKIFIIKSNHLNIKNNSTLFIIKNNNNIIYKNNIFSIIKNHLNILFIITNNTFIKMWTIISIINYISNISRISCIRFMITTP